MKDPGWSLAGRSLHALMAVLIIATLGLGLVLHDIEPLARRFQAFGWHKSLGLLALLLVFVRLAWRWRTIAPPDPPGMPRWQRQAARASHVLLYVLMVVVPLSGWLLHSASDLPLRWFGGPHVPDIWPPDKSWKLVWQTCHRILAWTLLGLLVVHVAAALKHHFIDGDTVLRRMFRRLP